MARDAAQIWRSRLGAALIAAVVAFVVSEILVAAHAAKYGDGPHEHGGQVCVLSLVAPHMDKAIATTAVIVVASIAIWRSADQLSQTERALLVIRAAKPRGPPSL